MGNGGNGVQGVWATWAMGPMGNVDTGGNGEQGIWGTWAHQFPFVSTMSTALTQALEKCAKKALSTQL